MTGPLLKSLQNDISELAADRGRLLQSLAGVRADLATLLEVHDELQADRDRLQLRVEALAADRDEALIQLDVALQRLAALTEAARKVVAFHIAHADARGTPTNALRALLVRSGAP